MRDAEEPNLHFSFWIDFAKTLQSTFETTVDRFELKYTFAPNIIRDKDFFRGMFVWSSRQMTDIITNILQLIDQ